jgi:hypothetical protein
MLLNILWHDKETGSSTDLLPVEWFSEEGRRPGVQHDVIWRPSGKSEAKCNLAVKGSIADFDYRPFAKFNKKRDMDHGVMRICFKSSARKVVSQVQWKDGNSDKFLLLSPKPEARYRKTSAFPDRSEDKIVLMEINSRRGQPKFRQLLLNLYEGKCAVSGCSVIGKRNYSSVRLAYVVRFRPFKN